MYTIIFEDNSVFNGGTITDTKWNEIPNKKIKSLFYLLPNGDCLGLHKYDKYYHLIEATLDLIGENKGKQKIEYAYIIGKRNNLVTIYKINLCNKKYESIGNIQKIILSTEDEFVKGLNPQGWK